MSAPQVPSLAQVCIVGGAGFIGSHFVDRLLGEAGAQRVVVFDNFSSGREWHLAHHASDGRLRTVRGDAADLEQLTEAMQGCHTVIHLASNPDIARAATEPAIDFDAGTLLTHRVVEAMRLCGAQRILYASGSGVYGDLGERMVSEDHGPLLPISTYGASKLAGEALISSYVHMFDLSGCVFRFGNVVGPRQTHGVGFDFIRRLRKDSRHLRILGDGSQSKSYVHVRDVIDAVLLACFAAPLPLATYNVATDDYVTVREIAELAIDIVSLDPASIAMEFTGSDRGWRGDVPVVRLDTSRIRRLGWCNSMSSYAALRSSLESMVEDAQADRPS